jgi:hypothetical protein
MVQIQKNTFAAHIKEAIKKSHAQGDMMIGLEYLFFCNMSHQLPYFTEHNSYSDVISQDYFKAVELFKRYMRVFHKHAWQKAMEKTTGTGRNENASSPYRLA